MKATLQKFKSWLHEHEEHLTLEDMADLETEVHELRERVQQRIESRKTALLQALEVAKAAGFNSLEELLAASKKEDPSPASAKSALFATPRKPYLIPDDPDTAAYAVYKNRVPPQVSEFLQRSATYGGRVWTLGEMHYRQVARARVNRGLAPDHLWDPVLKHEDLLSAVSRVIRRSV